MISPEYVRLMAAYTHSQNESVYAAASRLSDEERRADRGAFFGSIHATLNHLLWGDQFWMHRLTGTPEPSQPDIAGSVRMHDDWASLRSGRSATDEQMLEWSKGLADADLTGDVTWYSGAAQANVCRPRWALVVQLFNHGTHHRGQIHAMLTSAGATPGVTDVQHMASEHYPWR